MGAFERPVCSGGVACMTDCYTAGTLLKESIEDLEWTAIGSNNSTVEICLQRQPRRLFFTAQAAGSLQVSLIPCVLHQ